MENEIKDKPAEPLRGREKGLVILLVIAFFALGVYVGVTHRSAIEKVTGIENKEPQVATTADFGPFWEPGIPSTRSTRAPAP
ncbi:MAG: hypothetical protein WDN09_03505 [bacterium]